MRFHPSQEQLAIQDALRRALADTLSSKKLHEIVDGDLEMDRGSWDTLMQLGVAGMALPERFAGSGLGLLDAALACEILGNGAASGPVISHLMASIAINQSRDESVKADWLPDLAGGRKTATVAFGGNWTPESWEVTEREGRLCGAVRFVQGAGSADVFVVGLTGSRLALARAGEGVTIDRLPSTDRSRGLSTVMFDNAPASLLHTEADRTFDAGLILVAADALGGAQKATDMSVAYAKERVQFGHSIGHFQAVKHQLATMALEVEPARALVWYAAYAWDQRLPEARRIAAIAKAHLADRFVSVARAAVAVHGGIGYTWEYDLSIWVRRSFFNRAFLGGPVFHRARAAQLADW